jgi:ribose transport system substrate-binding protein
MVFASGESIMPCRLPSLLTVTVCLALCGCGGGGGGNANPEYKYKVAVIPKGLTHEFWQSVHRGAEQAGEDLTKQGIAVQIIWDGPRKEDDAQAQIDIITQNLNSVQGLVLAPQHSETMVAPVQRAQKKGIPTVIIDSGLANQDVLIKYIATNNYNGGWMAAEHLLKVLRDEGKMAPNLVLLRYQAGSESTDQREQGFIEYVEKIKKESQPGITWLSNDQYAGATKDSAMQKATPLLNGLRDKGIDGIFAPNESSASGTLQALRSLKMNKTLRFVGFDSSEPLLQALKEGDIDGLIVQDPYKMGYLGVWTLVQYLEGYNVSPDGKKERGTGENLVTKANLEERSTRELFEPELQKQRKIELPQLTQKR